MFAILHFLVNTENFDIETDFGGPVQVSQASNPSYSGGRNQEDPR
jgi:hypothetical protein